MAAKLSPIFNDAVLDSSGNPYSGAQLFTYAAGSSTKQTAYQDQAGTTPHTNPIVLNSRGEPPAPIWLTEGSEYKFVLTTPTDTDPPAAAIRTVDDVSGVNDGTGLQDEWIASGFTPTFISATSFSVSGDRTTVLHVGRRLKTANTGGTIYSTITASSHSGGTTTVTVVNDSGSIDSGISSVSYSIGSASNPSVNADMVNRKASAVASAATTNIWGTAGDFVHVTGTTTITSLGTAPYAGAERTVVFDGALTLTHNGTTLVLPGSANITTAANDRMTVRADTTDNMIITHYTRANATPHGKQPTRQVFTSGSGTYTTPTGATRINVRMVGGGGGGSGRDANNGSTGGNTTFSTLTASGGAGGTQGGAGGAGGAAAGGDINISGGSGAGAIQNNTAGVAPCGAAGGNSVFGGGGGGILNATGGSAATNSGGGGGGAGGANSTGSGSGGGAGGYVEKLIAPPAASYSYAVGAAGNGGAAGGQAGGQGAAGIIIVDEFYD